MQQEPLAMNFCVSCGKKIQSEWNICPRCGTAKVGGVPVIPHPSGLQSNLVITHTNESATIGLVLGIVSMLISILSPFSLGLCCFFSVPIAILGLACSEKGYSRSKDIGIGNVQSVAALILNGLQVGAAGIIALLYLIGGLID